jgi:hypothetical protein
MSRDKDNGKSNAVILSEDFALRQQSKTAVEGSVLSCTHDGTSRFSVRSGAIAFHYLGVPLFMNGL